MTRFRPSDDSPMGCEKIAASLSVFRWFFLLWFLAFVILPFSISWSGEAAVADPPSLEKPVPVADKPAPAEPPQKQGKSHVPLTSTSTLAFAGSSTGDPAKPVDPA